MRGAAALAALLFGVAVATWPTRPSGEPAEPLRPGPAAEHEQVVTVHDAAEALVLVAMVLRSGAGLVDSLEEVARSPGLAAGPQLAVVAAALRWGETPRAAWARLDPLWSPAAVAWQAATAAGIAPAGLLESAAERMRQEEQRRLERATARAAIRLVLPLGLCFLPAFILTTIVPVVLHLAVRVLID